MRFMGFHLIEVILVKIERDKLLPDRIGFVMSDESDKLFITFLIFYLFFVIDRYVLLIKVFQQSNLLLLRTSTMMFTCNRPLLKFRMT